MYFDEYSYHTFHVLNLRDTNSLPMTLTPVGSLTPYSIVLNADFIYLANQHPR